MLKVQLNYEVAIGNFNIKISIMHYFVITFQATLNRAQVVVGSIGSASGTTDHQPNLVKRIITEQMKKDHPQARTVAVNFLEVKEVDQNAYNAASSDFIEITED